MQQYLLPKLDQYILTIHEFASPIDTFTKQFVLNREQTWFLHPREMIIELMTRN